MGGSGTRLVAHILLELGFYLGSDLNVPLDNLWFTLLFKRPEAMDCSEADFQTLFRLFEKAMCGRGAFSDAEIQLIRAAAQQSRLHHDSEWLGQRAESLIGACEGTARQNTRWGWKEPNTHVVLPRLNDVSPEMLYIHVARNGLDMAYSENQSQLRTWGARFLGVDSILVTPRLSLKYWVAVHRRVIETGSAMGSRFLMLNYDRLCADPACELPKLMAFLGIEPSPPQLAGAAELVRPAGGIGRFKAHPENHFDPDDVAFVASMGFDTESPAISRQAASHQTNYKL